jgi:hypothetical protein
LKKNRTRRREMRAADPPITLPMIALSVVLLRLVVEEPGEELDELPDGTLVEVTVGVFEDVLDGPSC